MENQRKKCSSKEHKEIEAIVYCRECSVYMCNKCEIFHSNLCQNHHTFKLDKDISDIFTGFCKEEKHQMELEFFCKNHNQLCCPACISKIKTEKIGKHKDCDICNLEDIKDEKKNKLKNNIKMLEELSNTLQESINKLKDFYEKINKDKEEFKLEIQKIFTKIRNALNKREDELLLEVDQQFENLFFKEDIYKETEKLPNKIKLSLEKSKIIEEEYNNKINLFINDCIDIENNINEINEINENIKKCNKSENVKIRPVPKEEEVNKFLEMIKSFGKVFNNEFISSSIINNDYNKQISIINWIREKINKNSLKFELIFKMSKNGTKADDFHKICDDQGPTLTIIETTKNKIFGGFTPLNWKSRGSYKDDSNQTFIFSLNLMKKYDIINIKRDAIKCSSYGPNFGDCDIKLNSNMIKGETFANGSCNYLSNNNLELTGGKGENENFETKEFEVYKVIY